MKCATCHRGIQLGEDCFSLRQGVLGPRGFVPLDDTMLCSEKCLEHHLSDPVDAKERTPEFT